MIKVTIYTHDGEAGVHGEGTTLQGACSDAVLQIMLADPELKLQLPKTWTPETLRRFVNTELDGGLALISESPDPG